MINSEWYPADFDDYQCKALDAASDIANTEDLNDLTPYIKAIRSGNFKFLPDVEDYADLGYAHREDTGLVENLQWLFDWEEYGYEINRDYSGDFTSYGWIAFFCY